MTCAGVAIFHLEASCVTTYIFRLEAIIRIPIGKENVKIVGARNYKQMKINEQKYYNCYILSSGEWPITY